MFSFHDYLTSASKLMVLMQTVSTSSSSSWARTAQPGGYREKSTLWQGTSLWHRYWNILLKKQFQETEVLMSPKFCSENPLAVLSCYRSGDSCSTFSTAGAGTSNRDTIALVHWGGSLSRGSIIISINNKKKISRKNRKDIHYLERFPLYSVRNAENTESRTLSCRAHFPNATILVTCKLLQGSSNPMQCYLKSRNQTAQQRPWKMHSE